MRQSGKNARQRGRGVRRGNNVGQINRNTVLDSNGPDMRLRGNAQQLHEKYTSLGNEAAAAGERISAEAYFQHADHYFRVHSTIMAAINEKRQQPGPRPVTPPTNAGTEPNGNVAENTKNGDARAGGTSAADTSAADTSAADTSAADTSETPSAETPSAETSGDDDKDNRAEGRSSPN